MAINSLTGSDTFVLNGRVLNDFGKGDVVTITYPESMVEVVVGKNKNSIYSENTSGQSADIEVKILTGSADDKFVNSLFLTQQRDLPAFTLLTCNYAKRVGDGASNISNAAHTGSGGIFAQGIDAKENTDGDTEAAQSIYKLKFSNLVRTIA
tara:strand:- start:11924 stop:12379 length:456 start_codon:yes stop_codon:yes gene_type:complete